MKEPLVAIVGRPNVGKSTLFNRIVGRRVSIVNDEPGVTRDRIFSRANWQDNYFTLIDTGGIDFEKNDEISTGIVSQAKMAIDMTDVILFVVSGADGITASDRDIVSVLRKSKKKIILVVNKVDNYDVNIEYEFYELGLGKPFLISASHGNGVGDLLEEIVSSFPEDKLKKAEEDRIKIAIIGKPNAGKSSIINRLVGENRVIVSGVAGTTRDSIDIPFNYNQKKYTLIDTAGMRRKSKIEDDTIERYSIIRTLGSVTNCDVCVLVVDASENLSDQDLKIIHFIHEEKKPFIIVFNKWDLVEKDKSVTDKFNDLVKAELSFIPYFKSVNLSALTGKRMEKLMQAVEIVMENSRRRVSISALNDVLNDAYLIKMPNFKGGKKLRIFYATQVEGIPPQFILFVNDTSLIEDNYLRYLENCIRKAFDFTGTPIIIKLKSKREEDI